MVKPSTAYGCIRETDSENRAETGKRLRWKIGTEKYQKEI